MGGVEAMKHLKNKQVSSEIFGGKNENSGVFREEWSNRRWMAATIQRFKKKSNKTREIVPNAAWRLNQTISTGHFGNACINARP